MVEHNTCFRNCRHVLRSHDLLKKVRGYFEVGRRVLGKWFYSVRSAEEKSIAIYTSDFKERRTCTPYWAFCEGTDISSSLRLFGRSGGISGGKEM